MNLSTGIIGFPNVGKSTLFSAITNSQVEIANYAFATIDPNIGIVNLNDERLNKLANIIHPEKVLYATCKFVDIAGLVKGASKGEGLGNKFLQNIREVDALCHVVRCFKDVEITHSSNVIDPVVDLTIINLELIYADLEIINSKIERIKNKANSGEEASKIEYDLFLKLKTCLDKEKMISTLNLSLQEQKAIKSYSFLTAKPMIYIANIDDDDIADPFNNLNYKKLVDFIGETNVIPVSIKMEHELSQLNEVEKKLFRHDLNIKVSGLDSLISKTYEILGLATYFTYGKKEVRAWSFKRGMTAQQCAGIIHSDFEKGFIKAEVIQYEDLIEIKDELKLKELGKVKLVGREYIANDGEIYHFRFNN